MVNGGRRGMIGGMGKRKMCKGKWLKSLEVEEFKS